LKIGRLDRIELDNFLWCGGSWGIDWGMPCEVKPVKANPKQKAFLQCVLRILHTYPGGEKNGNQNLNACWSARPLQREKRANCTWKLELEYGLVIKLSQ
jgi:hypothetical protein